MSNPIIESLYARRSLRVYADEEVSAEDERAIIEAACQAPTAGNQQLYSIIVVRSQAKKDALAKSCDNQPFIAKAPLVLVFCADVRRWYGAFLSDAEAVPRMPGVGDALLAFQDATIAAQNAVVAAESLGLGSCYIGDILENCEIQKGILKLPPYVMPAAMLCIGHPAPEAEERPKPVRFPLETLLFEDAYRLQDADELLEAVSGKLARKQEGIAAFCERKWNAPFSREMTRSVAKMLEGFPYDSESGGVGAFSGDADED